MIGWLKRQASRFGVLSAKRDTPPGRTYTDNAPTGRPLDDTPRQMPAPKAPRQGHHVPGRVDHAREYAASAWGPHFGQYLRSLPQWIDPLTRDFGEDLYERMLLDDDVWSSWNGLRRQVLSEPLNLHPAVAGRHEEGYDASKAVLGFCERVLAALEGRSADAWLAEMFFASALGNKLAEKVWEPVEAGRDAGRFRLKKLKTKPRGNTAFVLNAFNDEVGIRAVIPGVMPQALPQTLVLDPAMLPGVLPREKFAVLSWDGRDGDPRGTSLLPPAYELWWHKRELVSDWMRALAQFGTPFVAGYTAEGAQPRRPLDDAGNEIEGAAPVEPTELMMQALNRFRAGGTGAFAYGSKLDILSGTSGVSGLLDNIEAISRKITKAIRLSTRDTVESEYGSKADSETSQDVTGNLVRSARRDVEEMARRDVIYPLVLYNFGPTVAERFCPKVSLAGTEHHDFVAVAGALNSLVTSGLLRPSQDHHAYEMLGFPPPRGDERQVQPPAVPGAPPGGAEGQAPGGESAGQPGEAAQPAGGGTLAGALPNLFGGG